MTTFIYNFEKTWVICRSFVVTAEFSVAFEYSSQTSRIFKVYKTLIAQKVYVPSFVSMYFSNRNNFTYNKKGFPTGQISTFSQMKWKVTFWKQFSIDFRAVKNRCFFKRIPTMQAKFFKTIFAKNSFVSQMQKILQTQKFPTLTVKIPKTQVWKHALRMKNLKFGAPPLSKMEFPRKKCRSFRKNEWNVSFSARIFFNS